MGRNDDADRWSDASSEQGGGRAGAHAATPLPLARLSHHHHHKNPSREIQVTHGCLLLPVILGAWWIWMRRKARGVMRVLHLAPPVGDADGDEDSAYHDIELMQPHDDDPFQTWEDVDHQRQGSTVRLVQWFKGNTSRTARARRKVQAATLHNLRQRPSIYEEECDNSNSGAAATAAPPHSLVASSGAATTADNHSQSSSTKSSVANQITTATITPYLSNSDDSGAAQGEWQCIHDTLSLKTWSIAPGGSSDELGVVETVTSRTSLC